MGNFSTVEGEGLESLQGFGERSDGLFGEKQTVLAILNKITAATFGIGDDRTTSGEGFDSGDTEWFEAGKKISGSVLQKRG